jgi:hypothetical protein
LVDYPKRVIFALENRSILVLNEFKNSFKVAKLAINFENMTRKKKIIQIPPKNVEMLSRMMNVGRVTVYNALAYRSDSENAKLIRQKAISDYGGIETTKTIL